MKAGKTCLECCSKPMLSLFFSAVLATAVLPPRVSAQTQPDNWNGGSGLWSNAANWSLNAPPMPGNDCTFPAGSTPTDDLGGTCNNLTLASGDTLTLNTGHLDIYGTSMTNSGTISVAAATPINIGGNTANTVSLSGGGTIVLSNANAAIVGFPGINGTLLNVNNTIQGHGGVGNGAIGLNNQGTITASGGTLTVQPSSTGLINTGTMQAASGGNLTLQAGFSSIPFTNTGGTIAALSGGTVVLNGATFIGGTLSTSGTGTFQTSPGGGNPILSGLTNAGSFLIPGGAAVILEGIETNTGSFQMQGSDLQVQGAATLQGAGNVTMTDSGFNQVGSFNGAATLTLAQTISGAGNVGDANLTLVNKGTVDATGTLNHLIIAATSTTNSSTLEATGGGTLELRKPIDNTAGTIEALNGSTVLLNGGTISGGVLTTSGTGSFQVNSGTLDGTTSVLTNSGALIVADRNFLTLQGTINNSGVIALDSSGGCLALDKPTTLEGTGVVTMTSASADCFLASAPSDTLTNKSTIEGTGTIGDSNPMGITNAGTIIANQSTPLTIAPDALLGFTNTGTLIVNGGSMMNINGPFKSLKSSALKSGTYSVAGILEFPNAIIKTNSGKITLTGAAAQIRDNGSLNNALIALVTNNGAGLLSLQSGATLTTTTNLTNKGKVMVGTGSSLSVNGYTQGGGTSTIDGTITAASGFTVQAGSLLGKGTLAAAVTSNGIITPGDSTTNPGVLTISGTYTQSATGTLKIYIAGAGAGQYGKVPVSNGVSLNGTLDLSRVHGFVPTIGSTFTLVSGSAVTGQFATVNGASINASEHFQVNYTPTAVTVSVVSGP